MAEAKVVVTIMLMAVWIQTSRFYLFIFMYLKILFI